jgi:phage RecT family recombinase
MATSQGTEMTRVNVQAVMTSEQARKYIEPFLPEGVSVERVAAAVQLAVRNDETGKLAQCTPASLVTAAAKILQWGLEIGTTAFLVPFKGKAVPIASYQGLAALAIASGAVRFFDPQVVREGDRFEYELGTEGKIRHTPLGGRDRKKAPITHAYCVVTLPFGAKVFDVMTIEEIDEVRLEYSKQWKQGACPPWYAKKTIVRRITKLLPKDPKLAAFFNALRGDQEVEVGDIGEEHVASRSLRDEDDFPVRPASATATRDPGEDDGEFQDDRDLA